MENYCHLALASMNWEGQYLVERLHLCCSFLSLTPGETLLSPLVMCGPHGLKFLKPVELRLPHCASMTPDGWSFALKSSDSSSGMLSSLCLWGFGNCHWLMPELLVLPMLCVSRSSLCPCGLVSITSILNVWFICYKCMWNHGDFSTF